MVFGELAQQRLQQVAQQCFASLTRIVHELKEPQIEDG